jgi:arginyl-tRNA synthetase
LALKKQLENLLDQSLAVVLKETVEPEAVVALVERTREVEHGHFASNIAMRLAKQLRASPRDIAQQVIDSLPESELVEKVEIAGPGFINFYLTPQAFHEEMLVLLDAGEHYGKSQTATAEKVLLEYVSANPTGPLHVGHGRHAAYGACIANLLRATGNEVHEEYYVNDAGRQMDILALSVWLRALEAADNTIAFPAGGYRGGYVTEIAEKAPDKGGAMPDGLFADLPDDTDAELDTLIGRARETLGDDGFRQLLDLALADILGDIRDDLQEFGVNPNEWFSERSLEDSGAIKRALDLLATNNVTYEKEGAIWFRATDYGDEKDRVVVRDNGRTTYFASDIAYHLHKRERGYQKLIDVLGSDHHGYVPRVRAGLTAMGESADCLEVDLVQFVVLYRSGKKAQMSTRSGEFVTLRQLRKEVGNDAARLFFVMRSNEQHLDFDLDLAKSSSNENPVYYLQYAHARICSVMRELASRDFEWDEAQGRSSLPQLTAAHEMALMIRLSNYPEMVLLSAEQRAPQHIAHYLKELAQEFHAWYNAERFIVADAPLRNARITLALAARQVMRNGLALLGVSAPDDM